MDVSEQIRKFEEFIEQNYHAQLMERIRLGDDHFALDFIELSRFDPELADSMLEQPEDALKAAELAILSFDLPKPLKRFHVRIKNLPESQMIDIRDIRSKHIGKFFFTEGIVRQKTDVRPQVTTARFECPSCGNVIPVLQLESKFKEPSRCGCGRKGKFKLLSKDLVDVQKIALEESPDRLDGADQPKRMDVFLKNDLVSPLSDKKTNPGTKVRIVGNIVEVPIPAKDGGKLVRFDLMIDANFIEPIEEDFGELLISKEEETKILELAKDPKIISKLVESIAPSIYGHDKIKEAIIYQLLGGVKKKRSDGAVTRGDMHILLVGDPGSGKSQLLKRAQTVAPKSRYISGKGASGAGLTAAVVKDEFLKGWSLEAGALVLANKGFVMIDELDKMTNEDRSAMHEALEQQCFHKDTVITLADGSEQRIGPFVESLFSAYPERTMRGHDCSVIPVDDLGIKILSTDWRTVFPVNITKVSRHIPFDHFYVIKLCNGREVKVTPDHPVFCIKDCRIITKPARRLRGDEWIPVPLSMPIPGEKQLFGVTEDDIFNARASNHISIPLENGVNFYKVVGYLLSEGSRELNRGKLIGVNFTNKDPVLLRDFEDAMYNIFNIRPYAQIKRDDHEPRTMLRYISTEVAAFFLKICPEVLEKSEKKRVPQIAMRGSKDEIKHMLSAMFDGDGHVSKKPRTIRVGFASNSRRMCEQVQDLLLRYDIRSNLTEHEGSYKVSITGYENIWRFQKSIGFVAERKTRVIDDYLKSKKPIRSVKDIVPNVQERVISLMKKYHIKTVGKNDYYTMKHDYISIGKNISRRHLKKLVLLLNDRVSSEDAEDLRFLDCLANGRIGFEQISHIRKVKNDEKDPVYDITIEPSHAFVSQNMILHNTVTISKANIQATLRCETTVLAAANPKFGRFDPYELIAKQIDLPPALISRFDLIFPIRDLPNEEQDTKLASFLLNLHQTSDLGEPPVDTNLLRKFIAYARRRCQPKLTDGAIEELQAYYIKMRNSGGEDSIKSIPITARQLEALVRLAEASAKSRLSDKVSKRDAKKAVELLHYCMSQVGIDPETGKIDIDVLTTGVSSSARSHIMTIKEVISELENKIGKTIPIEEVIREAHEKHVDADKVEEILEKLKRSGDIFEPRKGFVQRL